MKIRHEDLPHLSPVDAAVLLAVGWVREWPWEMDRNIVRLFKKIGYYRLVERARETVLAQGHLGELTERKQP